MCSVYLLHINFSEEFVIFPILGYHPIFTVDSFYSENQYWGQTVEILLQQNKISLQHNSRSLYSQTLFKGIECLFQYS